jgi:hypothetical protein
MAGSPSIFELTRSVHGRQHFITFFLVAITSKIFAIKDKGVFILDIE